MNDDLLLRYSRHILLPEIDVEGQQQLIQSRVLAVGVGGLGSPALIYLAAAGVGELVIYDDDQVDLTNLQRQIAHRSDALGHPKVESAKRSLYDINPHCRVEIHAQRLHGDVLQKEVAAASLVIDCSDNFATRHAINRSCFALGTPLVSAAAIRFEGQLAVYDPTENRSPCYHCLFPDVEDSEDMPCAIMGVFSPLTGMMGTLQAAEAIKLLLGHKESIGWLVLFDAWQMEWKKIRIPRDPDCAVCAHRL